MSSMKKYETIDELSNVLTKGRTLFDEEKLSSSIKRLCDKTYAEDKQLFINNFYPDKGNRYQFENNIWNLGASLFEYLKKDKKMSKSSVLIDTIGKIISDRKYMHGRQIFIIIAGKYKMMDTKLDIIKQLDDDTVFGQCVEALLKMNDFSVTKEVQMIASNKKIEPWIEKVVKNYIKRSNVSD